MVKRLDFEDFGQQVCRVSVLERRLTNQNEHNQVSKAIGMPYEEFKSFSEDLNSVTKLNASEIRKLKINPYLVEYCKDVVTLAEYVKKGSVLIDLAITQTEYKESEVTSEYFEPTRYKMSASAQGVDDPENISMLLSFYEIMTNSSMKDDAFEDYIDEFKVIKSLKPGYAVSKDENDSHHIIENKKVSYLECESDTIYMIHNDNSLFFSTPNPFEKRKVSSGDSSSLVDQFDETINASEIKQINNKFLEFSEKFENLSIKYHMNF